MGESFRVVPNRRDKRRLRRQFGRQRAKNTPPHPLSVIRTAPQPESEQDETDLYWVECAADHPTP